MTIQRVDKDGKFWQVGGLGPLIEVDMSYDRREAHWCVVVAWQNDVTIELPTEWREEIEAWHDANVLYDWSD